MHKCTWEEEYVDGKSERMKRKGKVRYCGVKEERVFHLYYPIYALSH